MPLPSYIQAVICARVHAERNRAVHRERFVLAEEVVRRRVGAFDRGLLHAIDNAERRHQFAAGMHADLKAAAGGLATLF